LELRYFQDLKNPEIADILGITTHNAAIRISRAIVELRKIVHIKGGSEHDKSR
jgi:DNA-directed RNA polymerase specialized sigma24 family protein